MRNVQRAMALAALAAGVSFASLAWAQGSAPSNQAPNQENATVKTDPGFKANGQINTGKETQAPSSSTEVINIPSPEESRKATLMPDPKDPAPGKPTVQSGSNGGGAGAPQKAESQQAIGGPLAAGASAGDGGNQASASGSQQGSSASTTGLAPAENANWPIASTGQTAPAKFSERNDILDRTPIMALPMRLSDQDRARIFKDVMADKSQPSADAAKLKPADELSTELAFNDMHPLPQSLSDIDWIKKLDYVKSKDKVFLVEPSTRIVVDQFTQ